MKLSLWVLSAVFLMLSGCGGSDGTTSPSTPVVVSVPPEETPIPPVADPIVMLGNDRTVVVKEKFTLPVTILNPPPDPLLYEWSVESFPATSQLTLDQVSPEGELTITPDIMGLYVFTLTINKRWSDSITVEVTANPFQKTLHIQASYPSGGTVEGIVSYDTRAVSIGTNSRGLSPNSIYPLVSWRVVAQGGGMPTNVYETGQAGNVVEFCRGHCIFGRMASIALTFKNESSFTLQLLFDDREAIVSPIPQAFTSWGVWIQGIYRVGCLGCVPVAIISTGQLTEL